MMIYYLTTNFKMKAISWFIKIFCSFEFFVLFLFCYDELAQCKDFFTLTVRRISPFFVQDYKNNLTQIKAFDYQKLLRIPGEDFDLL